MFGANVKIVIAIDMKLPLYTNRVNSTQSTSEWCACIQLIDVLVRCDSGILFERSFDCMNVCIRKRKK